MINEAILDNLLLDLGHNDFNRGTAQLRTAVRYWDANPHPAMTKELYPAVAKYHGTTAARVERNMRHSIEQAWLRCDYQARVRWFGNSVNPVTGRPTVGEYVARLARICHDGYMDDQEEGLIECELNT